MKKTFVVFFALCITAFAKAEWSDLPVSFFGPKSVKALEKEGADYKIEKNADLDPKNLKGIVVDLNGDGKKELILEINLCGTGGCPFQIYDGATRKKIGDLFGGTVWIFSRKVNGWPILQTYSHGSATSGSLQCSVYDRGQYSVVSHVYLHEKSVEELFEKYKSVSELKW